MNVASFREMYVAELQEARSLEAQLVEALPKMAEKASDGRLRSAVEEHLAETKSQLERVDKILDRHGAGRREHTDQSAEKLIAESEKWVGMVDEPHLRDAGLIASAQRIEHYEMAVYGTLSTWAKQLGEDEDVAILHAILDEEKAADGKLTELAKSSVNPEAASSA